MSESGSYRPRLSTKRIKHYLELARAQALCSDFDQTKLGAVVIYKGRVISTGWNSQEKTHPLQKRMNRYRGFDPDESNTNNTIHAEMSALIKIRHLDIDWNKVSVFVYRVKKDGSKGLARPCPGCENFMRKLGIRQVYYSTNNGWGYEVYED